MKILYMLDAERRGSGHGVRDPEEEIEGNLNILSRTDGEYRNALEMIHGVRGNLTEINLVIEQALENWTMKRLSVIDRNILRLAVFEMIHVSDIPYKVSINEAIELAKEYGTENSGPFVNGVLDRVFRSLKRDEDLREPPLREGMFSS